MNFTQIVKETSEMGLNLYDVALWQDGKTESWQYVPCNRCNNSYSVAKVYIMTAIGLLWDTKMLGLEDHLTQFFPEHLPSNMDSAWSKVTIEHALTHRMGLDKDVLDIDNGNAAEYPSDDYLNNIFSVPLAHAPGTTYVYTDAAYYLLSRVVSQVASEKVDQLLYQRILKPMRIREIAWSRDPLGYPIGATGLYISAEDMVKIGALYLQSGIYDGQRLLSEAWVKRAMTNNYDLHACAQGHLFLKRGMWGQGMCFSPDIGFAVAWHGCEKDGRAGEMAAYFEQLALRMTEKPTQKR